MEIHNTEGRRCARTNSESEQHKADLERVVAVVIRQCPRAGVRDAIAEAEDQSFVSNYQAMSFERDEMTAVMHT